MQLAEFFEVNRSTRLGRMRSARRELFAQYADSSFARIDPMKIAEMLAGLRDCGKAIATVQMQLDNNLRAYYKDGSGWTTGDCRMLVECVASVANAFHNLCPGDRDSELDDMFSAIPYVPGIGGIIARGFGAIAELSNAEEFKIAELPVELLVDAEGQAMLASVGMTTETAVELILGMGFAWRALKPAGGGVLPVVRESVFPDVPPAATNEDAPAAVQP